MKKQCDIPYPQSQLVNKLPIGADLNEFTILNCDCLGARMLYIPSPDFGVSENEICLWLLALRWAEQYHYQQGYRKYQEPFPLTSDLPLYKFASHCLIRYQVLYLLSIRQLRTL